MPVIHLVRHGQASFGAESYDVLSGLGREQARMVGAELARRAPRDPLIVCGTLERQRDTAKLLAEAGGFAESVEVDARWNEYDHRELITRYAACAEGADDVRGVQGVLDQALRAWIADAEDDGWATFAQGAMDAVAELPTALGGGRDAIVVTSGGILAAIGAGLLSSPPDGVIALNRVVVNAAITTLVVGSSGTSLLTFNDHAHFLGQHRSMLTYR